MKLAPAHSGARGSLLPTMEKKMPTTKLDTKEDIHGTGGALSQISYSATIIGGMTNSIESQLDEIMEYLGKYYGDASSCCRENYETIHCCMSVIRDHVTAISNLAD